MSILWHKHDKYKAAKQQKNEHIGCAVKSMVCFKIKDHHTSDRAILNT